MSKVKIVAAMAIVGALTAAAPGAAAAQPPAAQPPAQTPAAQTPAGQTPAVPDAALANRPAVAERVTFKDAVERALARNPSIEQAAADILRADALVRQARALTLPSVNFNITTTTVHPVIEFDGQSATPRNQLTAAPTASAMLYAPVLWAQRAQAQDNKVVAERERDEVRRQIGLASAQAYLAIIGQKRLAEAALRARDTARAHFDLAFQQQEKGSGSKLNELRAQQELSTDEAALEDALYGVYQAQEALGVLLAAAGPVDATEDPVLETPPAASTPETLVADRADIRVAVARELAAERVVNDSWKEYLPTVEGRFQPTFNTPETLFQQSWGWRALVLFDVPIFDFGLRAARKAEREALLSRTRLEGVDTRRQAASEVRSFSEAVRSAERALTAARAGANQAQQVVDIVNVAFRAGATTNIEVIDAQRRARDADTSAAITEDRLRRARLDLLVATGRFPQ
jgi:outer membrane protein